VVLKAEIVSTWLHLVVVLFLEIGSALGLIVARAVAPWESAPVNVREDLETGHGGQIAESTTDAQTPMNAGVVAADETRGRTRRKQPPVTSKADAQARLVDMLRDNGGKLVDEGVRGLASLIGGKRSTVHNALAGLLAAGIVARVSGELVLRI
jgi:hypothetical protein